MNANDIITAEEMEAGKFWESTDDKELWCWSCFRLHRSSEPCNRASKPQSGIERHREWLHDPIVGPYYAKAFDRGYYKYECEAFAVMYAHSGVPACIAIDNFHGDPF